MKDLHVVETFKHEGHAYLSGYTYPVTDAVFSLAVGQRWGREPYGTEKPGHDPDAPVMEEPDRTQRAEIHPQNIKGKLNVSTADVRAEPDTQ